MDKISRTLIRKFPKDFLFGASTSAYQIEGAYNVDGTTESIWDVMANAKDNSIYNNDTGNDACKSYYNYRRDVEMLKELNVQFYRFSISWNRLLPDGRANSINEKGLSYYNKLIDEIKGKGIIPMATIYHFDLPQKFQLKKGWENPDIADYYLEYAKVVFDKFGDRVKHWVTFNEPQRFCQQGYGDKLDAPRVDKSGVSDYQAAHNVLRAHAKAYRYFKSNSYDGKIAICLNGTWCHSKNGTVEEQKATEKYMEFEVGWFANAILGSGNYPKAMIEGIDCNRLPKFTDQELKDLKGSADFLGFNYYTAYIGEINKDIHKFKIPSYQNDMGLNLYQLDSWEQGKSEWLKSVPWGLKNYLEWIKNKYNNPKVIIFENGFSSDEDLDDKQRAKYIKDHLNAVLDAIDNKCNIQGYGVWSLMDNFEWGSGYNEKFGLYKVDFEDVNRTRTQRTSGKMFGEVAKTKKIERVDIPDVGVDKPALE